ncbi:MAG: hypothetical protein RLN62_04240 [Rickettsiales bacterium]
MPSFDDIRNLVKAAAEGHGAQGAKVIVDSDSNEVVIFYTGRIDEGARRNIRSAVAGQIEEMNVEFYAGQEAEGVVQLLAGVGPVEFTGDLEVSR